jgi:hypothetical protein
MLAVIWQVALLIVLALACVVLFAQGLLNPRHSHKSELELDWLLGRGQRAGRKADHKRPGSGGRLFEKTFELARGAVAKSTSLGRKARSKLPV